MHVKVMCLWVKHTKFFNNTNQLYQTNTGCQSSASIVGFFQGKTHSTRTRRAVPQCHARVPLDACCIPIPINSNKSQSRNLTLFQPWEQKLQNETSCIHTHQHQCLSSMRTCPSTSIALDVADERGLLLKHPRHEAALSRDQAQRCKTKTFTVHM